MNAALDRRVDRAPSARGVRIEWVGRLVKLLEDAGNQGNVDHELLVAKVDVIASCLTQLNSE